MAKHITGGPCYAQRGPPGQGCAHGPMASLLSLLRAPRNLVDQPKTLHFCIKVAAYMGLFYKRHPAVALYVACVGLARSGAEAHALGMLLGHPDMTAGEAFSSFICSHLMTPAINAGLALLQVGRGASVGSLGHGVGFAGSLGSGARAVRRWACCWATRT